MTKTDIVYHSEKIPSNQPAVLLDEKRRGGLCRTCWEGLQRGARPGKGLTAIDLFAGAGGTTTGFCAAGVQVLAAVDTDPLARRTYAANHPGTLVLGDDVRELDPLSLLRQLGLRSGELSILTACAPCQTFSSLGAKNRRSDDPRNDLVERIIPFVTIIRPHAVVAENVPQLMHDVRFARFVAALRLNGYGVWFGVVNAADFGVPERRRRLVLVALYGHRDEDVPPLAPNHPALRSFARRHTVRQAFVKLAKIVPPDDSLNVPRTTYPEIVARRIAAIPTNGGSRSDLPEDLRLSCHKGLSKGERSAAGNVYGRMRWGDVAPTLTTRCTTPACGRYLHPKENRAITLREAAYLQTFPPQYSFVGGSMAIQAQIGNAVPPRLARAIATFVAVELAKSSTGTPQAAARV